MGVKVEWIDSVTSNVIGHRVFRDNIQLAQIEGLGVQEYDDLNTAEGVTYKYEVQAYNQYGVSIKEVIGTNISYITTSSPLFIPTGLILVEVSKTEVGMAWVDSIAQSAIGVRIYRDTVLIAEVPQGVQMYSDTTVSAGETYTYVIQAYNDADETTNEVQDVNVRTIEMSTVAWDISGGLSLIYEKDMNESNLQDIYWRRDTGMHYYTVGATNDSIRMYTCATQWTVEGSTLTDELDVTAQASIPVSVEFSDDGTKMFMCGYSKRRIFRYDLSIAWDITTAVYLHQNPTIFSAALFNFTFVYEPGLYGRVLQVTNGNYMVERHVLGVAWDLTTLPAGNTPTYEIDTTPDKASNFGISTDGAQCWLAAENNGDFILWDLSTPYDTRTRTNEQRTLTPYTSNLRAADLVTGVTDKLWLGGAGANVELKEMAIVPLNTDVIINGVFDVDSDWVKNDFWQISGGVAHCDQNTSGWLYQQNNLFKNAGVYRITFDLKSRSSGNIAFKIDDGAYSAQHQVVADNKTVDYTHLGSDNGNFIINGGAGFVGSIDNVKVERIS